MPECSVCFHHTALQSQLDYHMQTHKASPDKGIATSQSVVAASAKTSKGVEMAKIDTKVLAGIQGKIEGFIRENRKPYTNKAGKVVTSKGVHVQFSGLQARLEATATKHGIAGVKWTSKTGKSGVSLWQGVLALMPGAFVVVPARAGNMIYLASDAPERVPTEGESF